MVLTASDSLRNPLGAAHACSEIRSLQLLDRSFFLACTENATSFNQICDFFLLPTIQQGLGNVVVRFCCVLVARQELKEKD